MTNPNWNLQDAKNKFSALVDAAQHGRPQTVLRRGKPVAVVLSYEDYERYTHSEAAHAPSFQEHLKAFPKSDDMMDEDFKAPLQLREIEL